MKCVSETSHILSHDSHDIVHLDCKNIARQWPGTPRKSAADPGWMSHSGWMFRTNGQHESSQSPVAKAAEEHLSSRCQVQSSSVKVCPVWRFDELVEMLMPRSSVRSMCTTSPAECSIEKFVKTQLVPGRAAICCSWSNAFNCWAPLDMRRLPCHGPGLRKAAAKLGKTTRSMSNYTDDSLNLVCFSTF